MRRALHAYSLVWAMLLLMLISGAGGFVYDRHVVMERALQHGQPFRMAGVWWEWLGHNADRLLASATLILLYSLARKWFLLVGSPISREGPDARADSLRRIEQRLTALEDQQENLFALVTAALVDSLPRRPAEPRANGSTDYVGN